MNSAVKVDDDYELDIFHSDYKCKFKQVIDFISKLDSKHPRSESDDVQEILAFYLQKSGNPFEILQIQDVQRLWKRILVYRSLKGGEYAKKYHHQF